MITYQGTKLSSRFEFKDQTKFEHKNDKVYCCKFPENDCDDFCVGETDRRLSELLVTIREIKIHILYNIHKIRNTLRFG